MCAISSDCLGNGKFLNVTLNRTWTSDDRQFISTDGRVTDAHDGLFRSQIERDQFVRFADANRFGHAAEAFKVGRIDGALIAGDADGGTSGAWHRMAFETQFFD